ncbi:hypothetical protein V2J09_011622, partial [Rumex salicifolius]
YEGAVNEDGRGPSIWDNFTHQYPEKIKDGSNGDVANDFYHRYKDDIKLAKKMGLDSFRFSISWSRVLPKGKICGGINKLGIKFYHNLIDELLANDYANLLFMEFGDKVKYWATLNEPNLMTEYGYARGLNAPGRCSNYIGNCTFGNSATEPYLVAHYFLLCHAATVKLYRNTYKARQKGIIGITVATNMILPINNTLASRQATFLDPVVYGNYPLSMRLLLGNRLPQFTPKQSKLLKRSFDFLGLNYYTSYYAMESLSVDRMNLSYTTDSHSTSSSFKNGVAIGESTHSSWLYIYPKGLQDLLQYIKERYNDPFIFITENDSQRIRYHSGHLAYLLKAIKKGANVGGYYVWSWLDDFEWSNGFTNRIGLSFVDFDNGLKRYPKDSFYWFKKFLLKN